MKLEPCPFRVKINTETTLFRVYTRLVSIQNRTRLYRVLKLPPRCIQCEVAYQAKWVSTFGQKRTRESAKPEVAQNAGGKLLGNTVMNTT